MAAFRSSRRVVAAFGIAWVAASASGQTDCLGFAHTPLGNAQLDCGPEGLRVSTIGMEGGDGVSIDVAGRIPEGFDLEIGCPSLDADQGAPIGAFMEFRGLGQLNGLPGQTALIIRYEVTGPGVVVVTYDLRPLSAESVTALVFQDGVFKQEAGGFEPVFKGELTGLRKPKVSMSDLHLKYGNDFVAQLDSAAFFDGDGTVLKLDAGEYHLVFIGENPLVNLADFAAVSIVAGGGLKEFLIASLEVAPTPVACYADVTGDGTLDLFDFLGYVNLFNAGDAPADCNADGVLDLFDFLCFTNAFNAGC